MDSLKHVDAYIDGACSGNPGPGGYGVVLRYGARRRELSAGYRLTTNNRMELLAAVVALRALTEKCEVALYSDAAYVVKMMQGGWPQKWEANGWRRSAAVTASNADLWSALLEVCGEHLVEFIWLKGHAGDIENERCDQLAMQAARGSNLAADEGYELAHSRNA